MSVLVVGSVALDTVETPFGSVTEVLGGSAVYFAAATSLYTKVNLVGVVGTDFPAEHIRFLAERGVDTRGLAVVEGQTFRWVGCYDYEQNITQTLDTRLNVFADFHPTLPPGYEGSELVFLANIDPDLQYEVLSQVSGARLRVVDTMNFWIRGKGESLSRTISAVDIVIMDESEVRLLARSQNVIAAAKSILEMGPRAVIIKRGEYGALMVSDTDYFVAPAYPVAQVKDPTGAGDSFAGGLLGYLDQAKEITPQALRKAIVHGTIVASFTIADFSIDGLRSLRRADIAHRYREFKRFTHFDDKESTS
ncbi:MAG: sugar kinase [Dehalococcoidia bacterium]|nr:MAG: sugar kinase [Dehalococcoidia bacterium]